MIGRFSSLADKNLRYRPVHALYCHSEYLGRKVRDVESFDWCAVEIGSVVGDTKYLEAAASQSPEAELPMNSF